MRYDENHKRETRARVVKAAAAAVRAEGASRVGVAEIMARAGLTHGGFYAHFPSKEALLGEALAEGFAQGWRRLEKASEAQTPAQSLAAMIDSYVSEGHRDVPERGCPAATVASELPHLGPAARAAFDDGVRLVIASIAGRLDEGSPQEREALAGSAFAEMAGAVALSRAVSDPELSSRLLAESRRRIKARLGLTDPPAKKDPE